MTQNQWTSKGTNCIDKLLRMSYLNCDRQTVTEREETSVRESCLKIYDYNNILSLDINLERLTSMLYPPIY